MNDERKRVESLLEQDKGKWIKTTTPTKRNPIEFQVLDDSIQIRSVDRYKENPNKKGEPWSYKRRCIADLREHLEENKDWHLLGATGEENEPEEGSVEEWARSPSNPVNGFYGEIEGRKGRFSSFIPPILEHYHLAEVEHNNSNNSMKYKMSFL